MNKQILKSKLERFGLSEDESLLYLFLIKNGPSSPIEIARETGINRSKIYRLSENLRKLNLIENADSAWGQKIKAAPIENLKILLENKQETINQQKAILPELLTSLKNIEPKNIPGFEIKVYKGIDGLKQKLWNELREKEILVMGNETLNEIVGESFAEKLRGEVILRKIKVFELANQKHTQDYTKERDYFKFLKYKEINEDSLKIIQAISIYGSIVSIIEFESGEHTAIEIRNVHFANMFKQIFWNYWNSVD